MTEMLSIRPAAQADIPLLHALVESAYRGDSARRGWTHEADLLGGQRTDPDALAALIADPRQCLLLAFSGDEPAGCVQVSKVTEGIAYLGMLAVDPARQAGGLGRTLIAAAEDHARRAFGAGTMEMTVIRQRGELIAYYQRRGYALTGEERPFPLADPRFGLPINPDLAFVVLARSLSAEG